ncbi:hypothetical protein KZ483_15790 [Paenibacillus sp. sptzw28]|uniref:DUF6005 family protein n=1 Tax=Paenibacillus sp. sptzw28 TaxID=715179 RepID=UPI001C6EA6FB|nr:DUF6005 family protein [Paenibacillus sp. sptzw28]QYR19390.1 hypothetical protein KZ483_15790 [Paenibacillus sp. sptzw28]
MNKTRQVHCLLDCYASILEEKEVDFRPLYLGAWDAYFESNDEGIFYHTDEVADPKDWHNRFTLLYGAPISNWFNYNAAKDRNFAIFTDLILSKEAYETVIIMVDLFFLPYSYQYGSKHSPHFLIVKNRQGTEWLIKDPYFGWEETIADVDMYSAFGFMEFGMGRVMDIRAIRDADKQLVSHLFAKELNPSPGRLLVQVEGYVRQSVEKNGGYAPRTLFASIQDAGVIAKRYGSYDYALQYCRGNIGTELNPAVSDLVKGWENLMLTIARYGILQRKVDLQAFTERLDHLHKLERAVKEELSQAFTVWKSRLSRSETGSRNNEADYEKSGASAADRAAKLTAIPGAEMK